MATIEPGMTIGAVQRAMTAELAAAGLDNARLDARLLLAEALELDPNELLLRDDLPIAEGAAETARDFLAKRLERMPVSRILRRRGFWTLDLEVTADTLDPRPDSETLIEAVLDQVDAHIGNRGAPLHILDLGTGTGCLLLALLKELPHSLGVGVDISEGAVACARRNAARNHLADRARFRIGDWATRVGPPFNIIVSNPPYIPDGDIAGLALEVRQYDPLKALAGGPDGLDAYRAILATLSSGVANQALLAFEVGIGQAQDVMRLLEEHGWRGVTFRADLGGIPRVVVALPARPRDGE